MVIPFSFEPLKYYIITFFITFTLWFAGAYISFQEDQHSLYMLLMLPGLMAPFFISQYMIFTSRRSDLIRDFLNRLINPKLIRLGMLPVFFLIMPTAVSVSILISLPFGGSLSQFQAAEGFSFSYGVVPALSLLVMAATFEELGWRGYAFDSLQSRFDFFTASIVFGVLWSFWHFPLVFVKHSYQYEIFHDNFWYVLNFFVGIIPLGIIISWICVKNRKSVMAAVVFHFIVNISNEAFNLSQTTKCIETLVLAAAAAVIIAREKEMFFSKAHLQPNPIDTSLPVAYHSDIQQINP